MIQASVENHQINLSFRLPGSYATLCWVYLTSGGPEEGGWWRTHREIEKQIWIPPGFAWLAKIAGRLYAERRNREEGNRPYTETLSRGEWDVVVSREPIDERHDSAQYE